VARIVTQPTFDRTQEEAAGLKESAWNAIRNADTFPEVAAKAVADARRAVALAEDKAWYLNTLGVALYRAREFKEALDTLLRCDATTAKDGYGPYPHHRAFIAMARWKLGQTDEARADFAALRELASKDRWKNDEETRRFLAEAEALLAPPSSKP
jgi:Flp pilus assembly protein TadD